MERNNNERYHQNLTIQSWKQFCLYKKNIVFPENFTLFTKPQYQQYFNEKLQQLLYDEHQLYYLFMDKLQQQIVSIIQQLIDKQYRGHLLYQYQSLFLGNKKQLLVYIPHPQLVNYLQKYRLPNFFIEHKQALQAKEEKIEQLIIARNLAISLDKPLEDIQKITQAIQSSKDQQYENCLVKYKKLMSSILEDFNRQEKRVYINLSMTRYTSLEIIRKLCRQYQLYLYAKFLKNSQYAKFVDMIVSKKNDSSKQHSNDQQEQTKNQKIQKISKPKPLYDYQIESINHFKAMCRIKIPSYGNLNRIQNLVIETELNQQKLALSENTSQILVELRAYKVGVCKFTINSVNSAGKSVSPIFLKFGFDSKQQQSLNKNLWMLGKSQKGLIPKKQGEQQSVISQSTNNCFIKFYSGIDVAVQKCAMICDQIGHVATWGQIYSFKEKQQQSELFIPIKDFSYDLQVQKPFHMDQVKFIRKVSCGTNYYLLCDRLGRAYSHGYNICAQLGIGQPDPNQNTQCPIQIKNLNKNFIVDVIATKWGGSFAIQQYGTVYKWGAYQTAITQKPIKDSLGSVINFELKGDVYQQFPIPIEKKYISDPVKEVHSGNKFTYSLTVNGKLYGWGIIKYLGVGQKQDSQNRKIESVCNPILIMEDVKNISTNNQHTIVIKNDSSVYGWGNKQYLDGSEAKILNKPLKLSQKLEEGGKIFCGSTYTVLISTKNVMKIVNNMNNFQLDQYQVPGEVHNAFCQQNLISLLCSPKIL